MTKAIELNELRRGDIIILPPSLAVSAKSCQDHGMSVGGTCRSANDIGEVNAVFNASKARYLVVTDTRCRAPTIDPKLFLGNHSTTAPTPKKTLTHATVVELRGEDLGIGPDSLPATSIYVEDPSFLKRKFAENPPLMEWLFVNAAPDRKTEAADWTIHHVLDGCSVDYEMNGWIPELVGHPKDLEPAILAVTGAHNCRVRDYGRVVDGEKDPAQFFAPAQFFHYLLRKGARIARVEPANPHALDDALAAARLAMAAEATRLTAAKLREFATALRGAIKLTDKRAAAWAALARTAAAKSRWARETAAIKEGEQQ